MKKAFGMLEFLIVIVIITVLYFSCFHSKYGRSNPFDDNAKIQTEQEVINDKIQDIENSKTLKRNIENNLNEAY